MTTPTSNSINEYPKRISKNLPRYLKKSKDTAEEYLQSKKPDHIYAPAYNSCWADFDVYDDVMWIRSAFSKNYTETKEAWEELKEIARSMNCKKIQFSTKRNGKMWERLFNDMKVVQWKIEVEL